MAIVRNKPTPEKAAKIAAFGAAADAPEEPIAPPKPGQHGGSGPKSSLLRWEGNEDLRDAIIAYAKSERYTIHEILIESIREGFKTIKN